MAGVGLGLALAYQGLQILWPDALGTAGTGPIPFNRFFFKYGAGGGAKLMAVSGYWYPFPPAHMNIEAT